VKGRVFVISGPSGSGKDTLIQKVLERLDNLYYSISATTRKQRPGEVDGCDYYFLTDEEFERRVKCGEFLEWKDVFGERYGTLKSEIEKAENAGKDILLELDVKGALDVKRKIKEAVLIFILPPSLEALRDRLRKRGDVSEEEIEKRMEVAPFEIEVGKSEFDYGIVNEDAEVAAMELEKILGR